MPGARFLAPRWSNTPFVEQEEVPRELKLVKHIGREPVSRWSLVEGFHIYHNATSSLKLVICLPPGLWWDSYISPISAIYYSVSYNKDLTKILYSFSRPLNPLDLLSITPSFRPRHPILHNFFPHPLRHR